MFIPLSLCRSLSSFATLPAAKRFLATPRWPARSHMTDTNAEDMAVPLEMVAGLPVYDADGQAIPFERVYAGQKTIVEYVEDLAKVPKEHLKEVRLAVVGCAKPKFITPFRKETKFPHDLFCDPERQIYEKLGLINKLSGTSGSSSHVKSSMLMGTLKSTMRALKSMAMQGNVTQQGGAFVLGPGQVVHFAHHDTSPMDHCDIDTLLEAAGLPPYFKTVDATGTGTS